MQFSASASRWMKRKQIQVSLSKIDFVFTLSRFLPLGVGKFQGNNLKINVHVDCLDGDFALIFSANGKTQSSEKRWRKLLDGDSSRCKICESFHGNFSVAFFPLVTFDHSSGKIIKSFDHLKFDQSPNKVHDNNNFCVKNCWKFSFHCLVHFMGLFIWMILTIKEGKKKHKLFTSANVGNVLFQFSSR